MIPRTFHFVYGLAPRIRPFHLIHYLCLVSCIHVNRPEEVILHHHHESCGRRSLRREEERARP